MSQSISLARVVVALLLAASTGPAFAQSSDALQKADKAVRVRASNPAGSSRVIIQAIDSASLASVRPFVTQKGGTVRRTLPVIKAHVATMPNASLAALAENGQVARISLDRSIVGANELTGITIGSSVVRETLGYDGRGVGIAVIDSG